MKKSRRHRRKSCTHKIRYNTKNGAHIAYHVLKRKRLIFHEMRPYFCPYCHGWHIGKIHKVDYKAFEKLKRMEHEQKNTNY